MYIYTMISFLYYRVEANNEYYDGDKDNDKENDGFIDVWHLSTHIIEYDQ